jgi:hypothetical protein
MQGETVRFRSPVTPEFESSESMEKITAQHVLQLLIEYFATGNKETDAAAKAIIEWDSDYSEIWQEEMKLYREGTDWTGVRSVEAELLAAALQQIKTSLPGILLER